MSTSRGRAVVVATIGFAIGVWSLGRLAALAEPMTAAAMILSGPGALIVAEATLLWGAYKARGSPDEGTDVLRSSTAAAAVLTSYVLHEIVRVLLTQCRLADFWCSTRTLDVIVATMALLVILSVVSLNIVAMRVCERYGRASLTPATVSLALIVLFSCLLWSL